MKRKILLVPLVLLLAISFVATGCPAAPPAAPPAPAPEVMKWKQQFFMTAGGNPIQWAVLEAFADDVKVMSQGVLDIELYSVNEICPLSEMLDAVGADILQADYAFTNQWAGRDTAFEIVGTIPFGLNCNEYHMWYAVGDGQKYLDKLYHPYNVHALPVIIWLAEIGAHSDFPIETLADMQGKRYRMGAGMAQDILKDAGIDAFWCAGSEIYSSMDRGVIDICKWGGFTTNWHMKFHEVASYVYCPGWQKPGATCAIEMNLDRWNALPNYLKRILEASARGMTYRMANNAASEGIYLEKFKDYGVTITKLDDESLAKLKAISDKVVAEKCAVNPLFKEIYENQLEFIKGYREVAAVNSMPVLD